MKKLLTTLTLLLLASTLTACGPGETVTPPPPSEETPVPPTEVPVVEIGEVALDIDAEISVTVCAGQDPIVGGTLEAVVTTEDGNLEEISKVEFYIDQELAVTLEEPPFVFSVDTTAYEDEVTLPLNVSVYDLDGEEYKSIGAVVQVDNTPEPAIKPLAEVLGITWAVQIEGDKSWRIPYNDTAYFQTLCQNFNLHIVQYGAFMSHMQPNQGSWDYSNAAEEVAFAEANNLQTRFHPLVWGTNLNWDDPVKDWTPTPLWVHQGDFSREEMIEIMYDRIETVMNYFDRIDEWVVVNESLGGYSDPNEIMKNTVWTQKLGDDYVELAFKYARQIDPAAVLILNEYGVDFIGKDAPYDHRVDNFYKLVVDLLEKDTPIDAVGFQFHLVVGHDDPTVEAILENFARYEDLGLDVMITELDISIEEPTTPEELEEQARLYGIVMQACLESEACTSIGTWGHSDKYTWITQWSSGYGSPLLFDENMQPKPAFYTIIEVMESYIKK